jgi:RimJ/RimL family protein N-acetyltransferase
MLIAFDAEDAPLGQVRFDTGDNGTTISITIGCRYRGKGLGPFMLRQACQVFRAAQPSAAIHAYIKPENIASVKTFAKAGFVEEERVQVQHQPAIHCVLKRESEND